MQENLSVDVSNILLPMIDQKVLQQTPPLVICRGEGVYIEDSTGKRYLDCTAGLWNVNVGHGRPEIRAALLAQFDQIAYYSTFNGMTNPPSNRLARRLVDLLEPEEMTRMFFSSGGSDAAETSFKLARQYWKLMGSPEKTRILSLRHGYHGVHFGGLSASGSEMWRRAFEPAMPGFYQVENPYLYRNPWTTDPSDLGTICADLLQREILYHGADTIAAFIAEPVQGAGGVIVPPANYWPQVRAICDRHDILLIADEVVTGFGRTGFMFGARAWQVRPDIMNFAKGINSAYVPLGVTALGRKVASAWDRTHPLAAVTHGYTYSGHPLACAVALANLDIVERENLVANAAQQGAYFLTRLEELYRYGRVGDVRGKGLMLGIELVSDKAGKEPLPGSHPYLQRLGARLRANGGMIRIAGNRIILSPPLVFDRGHVDEAMDILHRSFEQCEQCEEGH